MILECPATRKTMSFELSHGQLQLTGRVFNFRFGHLQAEHFRCYQVKLPNLKLKTQPKQLLGSLPLVIALPSRISYLRRPHLWNDYKINSQKCFEYLPSFSENVKRFLFSAKKVIFYE